MSLDLHKTVLSDDRRYRYTLYRDLQDGVGTCVFMCLNPSTADETVNDATVRRCMSYASSWGYRYLILVNLYAYRATHIKDMLAQGLSAVGPDNHEYLNRAMELGNKDTNMIVAAWGTNGNCFGGEDYISKQVLEHKYHINCLAITKHGHPHHPLRLSSNIKPELYLCPCSA